MLAPWIISHFPPHRVYVEPFAGGASVLMRKPRSPAEVYNDLDEDVVNVFRVLRDPPAALRLAELLRLTPWSRVEFNESYTPVEDPIERARRAVARAFMAHGSTHRRAHRTGFRAKSWVQRQPAQTEWLNYPEQIAVFVERLRGVTIECRPALEVILQQDSPETLFYVDPPYVLSSRTSVRCQAEADGWRSYAHNLSDEEHRELAEVLRKCHGMVLLSGYESALYDELYPDWRREERVTMADGGIQRREVLWISPNVRARNPELFS
jgi:DNA adenine methylase